MMVRSLNGECDIQRVPVVLALPFLVVATIFNSVMGITQANATTRSVPDLADAAMAIFDQRCSSCHDGQNHPLDTSDAESMTADRGDNRDRFIEPGSADASYLWTLIENDVMPKDSEPLTSLEKQTIHDWIQDGARFPDFGGDDRAFVREADVLRLIETHLSTVDAEDREFIRYFSLHTLANNRGVTNEKLRLAAAGLAKALNSLSRQRSLIELAVIDDDDSEGHAGLVFALDLRDIGWDRNYFQKWERVLAAYPYGSKPSHRGGQVQQVAARRHFDAIKRYYDADGFFDGIAYVRADWFVANAMRPPLYHDLLEIPDTLATFESEEGFDHHRDFLRNELVRGGVLLSNVSAQPRVIDYHAADRGVWMSYDFLGQPERDPERGDITRFPLGPQFESHPNASAAFEHAGGEIIFTLPNGLHGYMLVDGVGDRIDAGPIDIVADRSMISGTPEIVNGLSCISCHRHGMIDFEDQISNGHAQTTQREVLKIQGIYRPKELQRRLATQRRDYLQTLERVIGPFVQRDDDVDKPIESFPEPITTVARLYQRDLDASQVAAELNLDDPDQLNAMIDVQTSLVALGMGVLPNGGAIKRLHWEARGRNNRESKFQQAAHVFGSIPVSRLSSQQLSPQ
ncbi:MAG: transcriptional regulator [Planctomycetota bacterium]